MNHKMKIEQDMSLAPPKSNIDYVEGPSLVNACPRAAQVDNYDEPPANRKHKTFSGFNSRLEMDDDEN